MDTVKVKVGGSDFEIQRFRGLKAILAIAALTRLTREVPDIFADVGREYRRRNTVIVTEAMSKLPRWEGFSKEDFDEAESRTGRREIELPEPMDQQQTILAALPKLLEQARKEVVRLLAILIVPNQELREADESDKVEDLLDRYKEVLLYEAEIDELADLAIASSDVLKDQLGDRGDRLGKLAAGLMNLFTRQQRARQVTEAEQLAQAMALAESSTERTSPDEAPTSSTSSEKPTDGTEQPLSTASRG